MYAYNMDFPTLVKLAVVKPTLDFLPVIGPRTLGESDALWSSEQKACKPTQQAIVVASSFPVSKLMIELCSQVNPSVAYSHNADNQAREWFDSDLKPMYQQLRVYGKRPWPQFNAAVSTGANLTVADLESINLMLGCVVVSSQDGRLVIPKCITDEPLSAPVIDHRGEHLTLFDVVKACNTSDRSNKGVAKQLAIDTSGPKLHIPSKIASRSREFDFFNS